jgi:hypothetical protein
MWIASATEIGREGDGDGEREEDGEEKDVDRNGERGRRIYFS